MTDIDDQPTQEPTTTRADASAETRWITRNWLAIAAISILLMLAIAVALLASTGVIDVFGAGVLSR